MTDFIPDYTTFPWLSPMEETNCAIKRNEKRVMEEMVMDCGISKKEECVLEEIDCVIRKSEDLEVDEMVMDRIIKKYDVGDPSKVIFISHSKAFKFYILILFHTIF